MTIAEVSMHGVRIGVVMWNNEHQTASFQYDPDFVQEVTDHGVDIQPSPFHLPLSTGKVFEFPALPKDTFKGLPGMLAESLPDKFGDALINQWLTRQGREPASFNPIERLCYIGKRGMGALEYTPANGPETGTTEQINISALVELANDILSHKTGLEASFEEKEREESLQHILTVGTSAGGARAKAIIAYNEETHEVRSGQIDAGAGFDYWLLKFDGIAENKDKETMTDPQGFGLIEYAYHLMAKKAGIEMTRCELLKENGRSHFMTKRFDRVDGEKVHMQSLGALRHYDFNQAGAYSYEQAIQTMKQLHLTKEEIEEQYRRACFNIVARNQDDHVKNIAFLMGDQGDWFLSPAYDLAFSYNPKGEWTNKHQMSFNAKRDGFELDDFVTVGEFAELKRGRAKEILEEVTAAVKEWPDIASAAGVMEGHIELVQKALRVNLI